jgi:triosephosphate isomerase (TIM)
MSIGKFIIGNWKMNGGLSSNVLVEEIKAGCENNLGDKLKVGICPPSLLVSSVANWLGESAINLGGQDCHFAKSGAHTGDNSAELMAQIGAKIVIVGHSERRANHFETSQLVCDKAKAAKEAGLLPIICVGETDEERKSGKAIDVVLGQVAQSCPADNAKIVVAYEPVWAIGTGNVASISDIEEMHDAIRGKLVEIYGDAANSIHILYGGSVNAKNADEILKTKNVDGALVGGASLKSADFLTIINAGLAAIS